jgi:hypothetical protein
MRLWPTCTVFRSLRTDMGFAKQDFWNSLFDSLSHLESKEIGGRLTTHINYAKLPSCDDSSLERRI